MIEAQKKVVECCGALAEKVGRAELGGGFAEKLNAIAEVAREQELLVPVVGAFSAGKSSMINSLLGDGVLPVAVTPETSLATELRYDDTQRIEAVKSDGSIDKYDIGDIKTMTDNAKNYKYARVFLNNARLREIEPLVLVDMPGFDSPLDGHDKAILEYLDRGCYYIILSSVDEGTISNTLTRRLREIEGFGREFAFFLSKADLKPAGELAELAAHYQSQIESNFNSPTKIALLENKSCEKVMECLKSLDRDHIFLMMFKNQMVDVCTDIITNLNLKINASKRDAEDIKSAVSELENNVEKLRQKSASEKESMSRRYSGSIINDVIADVARALDESVDELTSLAVSGNTTAVEQTIKDIVRGTLSVSIKEKCDGLNKEIIDDLTSAIEGINVVMKDLNIDDDFLKNLTEKVGASISLMSEPLSKALGAAVVVPAAAGKAVAMKAVGGAVGGGAAAAAAGATAATGIGAIVAPIVGILVMFLPEIIGGLAKLFGADPAQKKKELVRTKLSGEIFPAIKRKLRAEMPGVLDKQIDDMITVACKQLEEQLANKIETFRAQIEEKNASAEETKAKLQSLESIRGEINTITSKIMEWEVK